MQTINKDSNVPARSSNYKDECRRSIEQDFYPELRSWVQQALLDAERQGNAKKKNQLLSLLEEL